MGKIKRLDQVTANSIAAGEVVERPASVVKELCENALDAAASIISIDTLGGGVKRLQITDNGVGMDSEDALEAFERHATSKLTHIEDLDNIASMGFRGEALAAVSAVSRITLITKTLGAEYGTKVYIEGGELLEHVPQACPEGTSFIIEDLFYNTPARYKFLKKDSTEASKISEIVQRLALARPDVSFRLTHAQKKVLHTPGNNDLKSTVYAVFGKDIAEQSIYMSETKAESGTPLHLRGAIGLPLSARRNRNNQFFFVNDRLVKSALLTKALEEAYSGMLMHGQFPFAILKIQVPQNLIDINVHPQKMELRFWNEQAVYSAVYHIVKAALMDGLRHPEDKIVTTEANLHEVGAIAKPESAPSPTSATSIDENQQKEAVYVEQSLPKIQDNALYRWNTAPHVPDSAESSEYAAASPTHLTLAEHEDSVLAALSEAQLVGQLFHTYIIMEKGSDYFLIDQHAAHEKILYEEIIASYEKETVHSQSCLELETLQVSASEMAAIDEASDFIASLGFEIDRFSDNEIIIRAVPASLWQNDPKASFTAALDQITEESSNLGLKANRKALQHAFATKACKAAVKAHDPLSQDEIKQLITQLLTLDNPYQCPHGRPVIVRKTRYELEKLFKRVV